jgi:glycosyltransferase involved in cell wall biosynthesis
MCPQRSQKMVNSSLPQRKNIRFNRIPDGERKNAAQNVCILFYQDFSFFVMPGSGEGFGLVFLEAMPAGKPWIGTEGAAEEIIEHCVSGYIVRLPCSDELFEYMKRLFFKFFPPGTRSGVATVHVAFHD